MEKIREGESQKREDAGARKGRKVAKNFVFPVFCGSGGSKGRLAKAAGAESSGQMTNEKLHAVLARSTFGSKKSQHPTCSEQFCKVRCKKMRNTFGSEKRQNMSGSDHFWKLRCRKRSRRWGA